jgi:TIR domain
MSVFISWSGRETASYSVAILLKEFIPKVIQRTDCFISTETQAGTPWVETIFKELQSRNIGLVCVTRDNLKSPWLNFEAGAIAKNVGVARMCPVLIDLSPADVPPPLSSFQMKSLKREDVLAIFEMINNSRGDQALSKEELKDAFGARWDEFDSKLSEVLKSSKPSSAKEPRKDRELLEEILDRVRSLGAVEQEAKQSWLQDQLKTLTAWAETPFAVPTPGFYNFPAFSSVELVRNQLVSKFKSALDQLDREVWPMLEIAGNHFGKDSWMFTFPSSRKDVFDMLVASGPKRDALKNASRASGLKVALICQGEGVSFDPT